MTTTTRATGTTDIIRDIDIIGIMIMAITHDITTTIIDPTTIVHIPITTTGATGTEEGIGHHKVTLRAGNQCLRAFAS